MCNLTPSICRLGPFRALRQNLRVLFTFHEQSAQVFPSSSRSYNVKVFCFILLPTGSCRRLLDSNTTRHTPHATRHTPHTTHHTPHTTHHTQPMLPTSGFPRLFRRNIRVHTTHHTPHTTRNPCYLLAAFHASFVETSGYSFSFPQLVSCIPLYPLPHIIPCLYQDVCTSVMCRLAAFHAFHRNIRVRFHFSATRNMFQIDENEL